MTALAGANLIYGLGMFETGITMDYGQLIVDNEIAGMIKHTMQGIPVSDETLAVDVIHEVGQFGDFLSHDHTFTHMKTAQTHPRLIDRQNRKNWEQAGGRSMYEKAWEEALHVLASHHPEPLPEGVQQTLRDIVAETEEELGVVRQGGKAAATGS